MCVGVEEVLLQQEGEQPLTWCKQTGGQRMCVGVEEVLLQQEGQQPYA